MRVAAILAGGSSSRLGSDKALALLGGRRLIDLVIERLRPQADLLLLCAREDYGTGLVAVPDRPDGPRGPVAGVIAAARWLRMNAFEAAGFATAPVDAPYLPADLLARLSSGACAVASDGERIHPTFAYWSLKELESAAAALIARRSVALHELADIVAAKAILWPDASPFANVNTPEDLARLAR